MDVDQKIEKSNAPLKGRKNVSLASLLVALIILALILIGGAASYIVYNWQHREVVSQMNKVADLTNKISASEKQVADLKNSVTDLQSQLAASSVVPQEKVAIKITKTELFKESTSDGSPFSDLFVSYEITNSGTTTYNFSTKDIKLKDSQSATIESYIVYPDRFGYGSNTLKDQKIASGEKVTGYLMYPFSGYDATKKNFTVIFTDNVSNTSTTQIATATFK